MHNHNAENDYIERVAVKRVREWEWLIMASLLVVCVSILFVVRFLPDWFPNWIR